MLMRMGGKTPIPKDKMKSMMEEVGPEEMGLSMLGKAGWKYLDLLRSMLMRDQMKSMLGKEGLEDLGLLKSMLPKEDWKGHIHSGKSFPCQI